MTRHSSFIGRTTNILFLLWWCVNTSHALSSVSTPSRRQWIATTLTAAWTMAPPSASAANTNIITDADLQRMKQGYDQIVYLLDHFEQETTVCRENGGVECKRDAEPIRKVLGLRSTTDALFQIDKVFLKVKNMEDIDNLDDFYAATEDWTSAMNMSNSMAFISQFGEYNPGGGKDEVLKYLLESKKQVELARTALRTILNVLGVATEG